MEQTSELLLKRLRKPSGTVDVVLDTDTFNEIDDQYALAYLIRSDDKLNLKAIYAAPFQNDKAPSPKQGMEMSYDEILRILSLMKRDDLKSKVYKGSDAFLQSETQPVVSDSAKNLVKLARESAAAQKPLYVIAIGAITNVASALLLEPEIKNSIVLIWLGGHAHDWPDNKEFNLYEDIAAARIVFGCGVPLVQLPCMGVVSAFTTSGPELEYWLKGKNALCDYLVDVTKKEALKYGGGPCWTREIWDVAAVAWLLDGDFMLDRLEHSPIPTYDGTYSIDRTRHLIKYVYHIKRDNLFYDLFSKLAK